MSPQRTESYLRVVEVLDELGPSKLQPGEQDRIRDAADTLIFCGDLDADVDAREALRDIDELCEALVLSGRWTAPSARALLNAIAGCGPLEPVALLAA